MNGILTKIARFAVSKAAAFCYAVAVGVAGNLIFHFVQTHEAVTTVATHEAGAPVAPKPLPTSADPAPPRAAAPAVMPGAVATGRPASAIALPEPPAAPALPTPDSLPAPALKPAVLPSARAIITPPPSAAPPVAAPTEAALRPAPAPVGEAASPAIAAGSPPAATLPPLGPAIDVAVPPTPARAVSEPVDVAPPPAPIARPAVKTATLRDMPASLRFSDIWHPGRAVEKGLHWAGKQVPLIGGDEAEPAVKSAAPSMPIPLLPPDAARALSDNADAAVPPRKSAAPGPGSGGLY